MGKANFIFIQNMMRLAIKRKKARAANPQPQERKSLFADHAKEVDQHPEKKEAPEVKKRQSIAELENAKVEAQKLAEEEGRAKRELEERSRAFQAALEEQKEAQKVRQAELEQEKSSLDAKLRE